LREILRVQKLGKNHGGYHGETIDLRAVLREVETAAQKHGWASEIFYESGEFKWLALHRRPELKTQNLHQRRHPRRRTGRTARGAAADSGKPLAGARGSFSAAVFESHRLHV
jgi:hypothetical protein